MGLAQIIERATTNRKKVLADRAGIHPSYRATVQIVADLEDGNDCAPNATRYVFELHAGGVGDKTVTRQFIIDVPNDESGTTDVWVLDHTIEVGDSPEDGFATYTPVKAG